MKNGNKIILNEFKAKLKKIINMHPSQSIRFNQFMELLTINEIRSYSKNQIVKINKFFDNPLKICRIQVPLSFLQLQCVQECEKRRYFVIKVSATQVNAGLYQAKEKKHHVTRCLQAFTKILRKLYGSQKNWFKVLGGLTISISIDRNTFKKSVSKVLCNTIHSNCVQDLVYMFSKDSKTNCIQWRNFMKIIGQQYMPIDVTSIIQQRPKTVNKVFYPQAITADQFSEPKTKHHQRRSSLPVSNDRNIKSAYQRPSSPKRRLSTYHDIQQQCLQFPRSFSISAKPCILYSKRSQIRPNMTNCQNRKYKKISLSRKIKTQTNFFNPRKIKQEQQEFHFKTEYKQERSLIQRKTEQKQRKQKTKLVEKTQNIEIIKIQQFSPQKQNTNQNQLQNSRQ